MGFNSAFKGLIYAYATHDFAVSERRTASSGSTKFI